MSLDLREAGESRKILVSLLFGLFAVIFNYGNILLMNGFGDSSMFVVGNFFILIISLRWGWKYGLLAYLPWFLTAHISSFYNHGFVFFLQFALFSVWICLHGKFAEIRLKNKKWYYNIFAIETYYLVFMVIVVIIAFLVYPEAWIRAADLSDFIKYYLMKMITRNIRYHIFAGIATRFNFFRSLLALPAKQRISNLIILMSIGSGIIIWLIHIGINVFMFGMQLSVDDVVSLYQDPQVNFLMKVIMYLLFVTGIVVSEYSEAILASRNRSDAENINLKSILRLTVLADNADNITENVFMESLLEVFMNIIPETDFGTVYSVEDEYMRPILFEGCEMGINEGALMYFNEKYNDYRNRDIFVISDDKDMPFTVRKDDEIMELKSCKAKETMFIFLKIKGLAVAAISLEIKDERNVVFNDESLKMAALLKNIPLTYYHKIKDFESREVLYRDMITSVIQILSIYDPYTNEHSEHVADLSVNIAHKMGLNNDEINEVYWSALVHDIGKVVIPIDIISKKGKLDDKEYEIVKKHSIWGYETFNASTSLKNIAKVVKHHHERWDGLGYPEGLQQEEIPLYSRIIAVADSFDAMRTDRPYRKALTKEEAILEVIRNSGKQFDPQVVDAFYLIRDKF